MRPDNRETICQDGANQRFDIVDFDQDLSLEELNAPGPNVEDWEPSVEEQAREDVRASTPVRRPPGSSRRLTREKVTQKLDRSEFDEQPKPLL